MIREYTPFAMQANGVGIHPIYIMFPVTMAVSFSYLLPVSTPSNAIIFAYGDMTVPDMVIYFYIIAY